MPGAYLIATTSEVNDEELMQSYLDKLPAIIEAHGGTLLGGGNEVTVLEPHGTWMPCRVVVYRYPSMEAAKAMYNSPEHQAILPERSRAADSTVLLIEAAD